MISDKLQIGSEVKIPNIKGMCKVVKVNDNSADVEGIYGKIYHLFESDGNISCVTRDGVVYIEV